MSISGVSSSTNAYQSQFQQITKDFSALKTDLASGDLTTAQQAYTTLTQDLRDVRQAQGIQQATSRVNTDLAAVGNALQSGDLAGAQSAFATLTQDLQDPQQTQSQGTQQTYGRHHHHHHGGSSQAASTSSPTASTSSQTASGSSQTASTLSTDLAAVGSALQSGDLTGAQSAFTTLMQDLENSSAQNTAGTSGNSTLSLSVSFISINISV
jgi:hypothetical protein